MNTKKEQKNNIPWIFSFIQIVMILYAIYYSIQNVHIYTSSNNQDLLLRIKGTLLPVTIFSSTIAFIPWIYGLSCLKIKYLFKVYKKLICIWIVLIIFVDIYIQYVLHISVFGSVVSLMAIGISSLVHAICGILFGISYELYLSKSKKIKAYFAFE